MTSRSADSLVAIRTVPNEMQAGIVQAVLADAGIESWTRKADGFDYFGLGTIAAAVTAVTVRAADVDRVEAALAANREDSVDIDWAEVDVGEAEDDVARRIAGRGVLDEKTERGGRKFPTGVAFAWVVLIALGCGLVDPWIALVVMTPFAVVDVARRWRRMVRG